MKSRDDALALLHQYTKSDSLRKHALAVEQAMKACARKFAPDEDATRWGIAGLLHDLGRIVLASLFPAPYRAALDTAQRTDQSLESAEREVFGTSLAEAGFDDDLRRAIMGHAPYTGVPRETMMARALFACDELCGFLTACALVQPSKALMDVKPASVKKKLKDKAFARSVSRDDIYNGVQELGVDLDEHIAFVRDAMLEIAEEIGLGGSTPASPAGS